MWRKNAKVGGGVNILSSQGSHWESGAAGGAAGAFCEIVCDTTCLQAHSASSVARVEMSFARTAGEVWCGLRCDVRAAGDLN